MIDGLKDDMLHILVNLYVYNYKCKNILKNSSTDIEFNYEIIALNAMAENITIRVARMFDKAKSTRSVRKLDDYNNNKEFKKRSLKWQPLLLLPPSNISPFLMCLMMHF